MSARAGLTSKTSDSQFASMVSSSHSWKLCIGTHGVQWVAVHYCCTHSVAVFCLQEAYLDVGHVPHGAAAVAGGRQHLPTLELVAL
jgi:hypothetical protein